MAGVSAKPEKRHRSLHAAVGTVKSLGATVIPGTNTGTSKRTGQSAAQLRQRKPSARASRSPAQVGQRKAMAFMGISESAERIAYPLPPRVKVTSVAMAFRYAISR